MELERMSFTRICGWGRTGHGGLMDEKTILTRMALGYTCHEYSPCCQFDLEDFGVGWQ